MKVKDFLTKNNWTKGCFAMDINGNSVSPQDSKAYSWCLVGAIMNCYKDPLAVHKVIIKIRKKILPYKYVCEFNDNGNTAFEDIHRLIEELDI